MNKFGFFASAALLVMAAASCNVEPVDTVAQKDSNPSGQVSFKASFANVASKTSYQSAEGMLKTKWAANDSISVITYFKFDDGSQYVEYVDNFYSNCAEGAETAEFTGTLTEIPSDHPSLQNGGVVKRICYYPALCSDDTYDGWDSDTQQYKQYPYYSQYPNEISKIGIFAGDVFFGKAASETQWESWAYYGCAGFLDHSAPFDGMNRNDVMTGLLEGDTASGLSVRLKKQTYVIKLELDLSGHEGEKVFGYKIGCSAASFTESYIEFEEDGNLHYIPDYDNSFLNATYSDGAYTIPSDGKVTAYVSSKMEFTAKAGSTMSISVLRAKDSDPYYDGVIASSIISLSNDLECKKGYVYTIKCNFKPQTVENINIPDPTFKEFLLSECDIDNDGEISKAEAAMLSIVNPYNISNIQSFEGIQYCTNVKEMYLNGAGESVRAIDFSTFPKLERLELGKCGFETLDATGLKNLKTLYLADNQLTSIDVSKNTMLEDLNLLNNLLTDIDLSNNKELQYLAIANNKLSAIDISNNTKLTTLVVSNNILGQLDVTHNTDLTSLECSECDLTQIDLSHNTQLRSFTCPSSNGSSKRLTSIDLSHCPYLYFADLNYQDIAEIDLSNNPAIYYLSCRYCSKLTALKEGKSLEYIFFEGCSSLTELNLQGYSKMTNLNCNSCNLTSLNLKGCTALANFYCDDNKLTSLDLSDCRKVYYVLCRRNQIKELDLTALMNPNGVNCSEMYDSNGNNVLEKVYVSDPNYSSWLYAPGATVIVK